MKFTLSSFILTLIIFTSCISNFKRGEWVNTDDGVYLWLDNCDTSKIYSWDGDIFENLANGKGTLKINKGSDDAVSLNVNALYGAIDEKNIVTLDDGSKFVGNIIDGMMEGFGVLAKDNELYIGEFHESKPHGYLKWYKDNQLYYEGTWKNGILNGKGTLYKEDGSIKSGEWNNGTLIQTLVDVQLSTGHYVGNAKNNKPDGLGRMDYANASSYIGSWENGMWSGEGLYICNSDSIFATWDNGKANGDVIYRTNELFYEGSFLENTPTGVGLLSTSDGTFYSGTWLEGERCGVGDMLFANGDKYSGEWENNQFNGYGEYKYFNEGASYTGDWKDGLQNGDGEYICAEYCYQGQWENGWMEGDGILIFKNQDRYEGAIHENVIDGIGTYSYANGNLYEGEFVNGKITGLGIFQFKNGNRYEGEFYNGSIYGDGTMYLVDNNDTTCITGFWPMDGSFPKESSILFANGDLYEGPLVNGTPTEDGIWISGEERKAKLDKVENSATHKFNELYKKHRETINWCLLSASAVVTAIEIASVPTPIGPIVAPVAHKINVAINVADISLAIASAAIDVAENAELGEDNTESIEKLETEVAINAAFILVPKVVKAAKKPLAQSLKNGARSNAASKALKAYSSKLFKESAIKFAKGKVFGKRFQISVSVKSGIRKIESTLIKSKYTSNSFIALGRLLTSKKDQIVTYPMYLKKINSNPTIKEKLKLSAEGSSKNLGDNMRLLGLDKWVKLNERIRRYLEMPKRQVEPHHIIPSRPNTERGRKAREIWIKYFGSIDHPCNGIFLGRSSKKYGYKALAKGSNHVSNSNEYEDNVAEAIIETYKKYQKKYANNPEMMQKLLAETVDNIKDKLYRGEIAIGTNSHQVHTILSIFKNKQGVVTDASSQIINSVARLAIQ